MLRWILEANVRFVCFEYVDRVGGRPDRLGIGVFQGVHHLPGHVRLGSRVYSLDGSIRRDDEVVGP